MLETCVKCNSSNIEEICYDGYFEFESNRYPLKTKYLKCKECSTEYLGKHQIKENQEYIASVHLGKTKIIVH